MTEVSAQLGLLVAALGGAGIGVEREWSGHASGDHARFAGIRTFTLIGCVSGASGLLAHWGSTTLSAVLIAGPIALTVVAYARASRRDIDATTEIAAFVTIAAGLLAGLQHTTLASGIIAVTILLLVEKTRLHALVARIVDDDLRAAARFGVMAVVILPLLPSGPIGPLGGVRPQQLWLLVLFFTGLSFSGYLARRILGSDRAYPLTGALAGLVSSTNATLTFARLSVKQPSAASALASGATAACTVLFPRVLIATLVLDRRVAWALLPYLTGPLVLGAGLVWVWLRHEAEHPDGHEPALASNPLQVWPALQMALTFQVVLFLVAGVREMFGDAGLVATGAVLGLTDVDALTISMARSTAYGVAPQTAAEAITVGILANCVLKGAVAVVLGSRSFGRRAGLALAAMAAVLGLMLGVFR